jgi:hypothetical protein
VNIKAAAMAAALSFLMKNPPRSVSNIYLLQ